MSFLYRYASIISLVFAPNRDMGAARRRNLNMYSCGCVVAFFFGRALIISRMPLLQDLKPCAYLPHKKGKHTRTVVSDTAAHVTGATMSESLTNALVGVVVSHKVSEEPFREKVDT